VNSQTTSTIELPNEREICTLPLEKTQAAILKFIDWLEHYGETSYDFQTFYASSLGQRAKALYYKKRRLGLLAVAPMVFSEALFPSARRVFFMRQRFPIADAHYAMGFAILAKVDQKRRHYERAVRFLQILKKTRCIRYKYYCWGYPFDWETLHGPIKQGTPLITTVPYAYEAFKEVWGIDGSKEWFEIMNSIAQHALQDYMDLETSERASTCSYTPEHQASFGVVNASAYRAFLLISAAYDFSDEKFRKAADRNLNFVLESQNEDGSWCYAKDGKRNFIDHYHTCFVLKAIVKIQALTGHSGCTAAIDRGIAYYVRNLFDENGSPKPFAKRPRLTVYRRELYDYAECLNLAMLLQGRYRKLDELCAAVLKELLTVWQKPDGSFRSRRLLFGWDNTPMHRWAQAQLFRSLCLLVNRNGCESQHKA